MIRTNIKSKLIVWLLVASFMGIACNLVPPQGQTQNDEWILTQAAQTIQVRLTQGAYEEVVAQLTQLASTSTATETAIQPTSTETPPTATLPPSIQATHTAISVSATPVPRTATAIPIPCDKADFVKDVTFVDGSIIAPGATFTKVWRLKNVGSCTWDSKYALVFVSGNAMKADKVVPLKNKVFPGETVDLSVELVAPTDKGNYRSHWMISNATGQRFGYGVKADQSFWLDINVKPINTNFAYDFAVNVCAATWRSSAGGLACMSDSSSSNGSVILLDAPRLENGRKEDESTLWTRPHVTRGGWISGTYPGYQVKEGDHFRAAIGCLQDSKGCEVTFSLDYREDSNKVKNLGSWVERYDGEISSIDIDLSGLVGKRVNFILTVTTHGKSEAANAFWLVPSIRRFTPTATPTSTQTHTATPTATNSPTPTLSPTVSSTAVVPPIEDTQTSIVGRAVRQKLAQDLGLSVDEIFLKSAEPVEWPDSCLGLSIPDVVCTPMIVPGYRMVLDAKNTIYEAHTNLDGSLVYYFDQKLLECCEN